MSGTDNEAFEPEEARRLAERLEIPQCPPDPVPDPCPPGGSAFVYRVRSSATATRFLSFTPGGIPFDAAATGHIEPSNLWVPPNGPPVTPPDDFLAGIVGDAINSNGQRATTL